jgi:hypothetical protein
MSADLAKAVELYAVVHFAVIGLSHIVQSAAWVRFFEHLCSIGTAGAFANAFMSLFFGSIIVAFHNVWEGGAIVLTLLGWAQILKGTVYFLAPEIGLASMRRVAPDRAWQFQIGGAVFLLLAGWLVFRLSYGT